MKKIQLLILLLILSLSVIAQTPELWNNYLSKPIRGKGSTIANYSYAGYHYCEKALPNVSTTTYTYFNVTDFGAIPNDEKSDRDAAILAFTAANELSTPAVIYFPEGRFILNDKSDFGKEALVVTSNNVVIKGAGQHLTELYFDQPCFDGSQSHIKFSPEYPDESYWRGDSKLADVTSFPEKGAFFVTVSDVSAFAPGMVVNFDADLYARTERGAGYFSQHDVPSGVQDKEDYFFELHEYFPFRKIYV